MKVLIVSAPWCSACKELINKLDPEEFHYVGVADFDENADNCRASGIDKLPTVIFLDNSGELLDKLDMDITPDKIKEKYNQLNNN